jgi:hypothetical protein
MKNSARAIMGNAFGRRRSLEKSSVPKPKAGTEQERRDLAELLFSPLVGQAAAVVGALVVVVILAGAYASNMKGMGRALDDQWSRKTTGPVEMPDRDPAVIMHNPCNVRSLDRKFQEVQRQLGC